MLYLGVEFVWPACSTSFNKKGDEMFSLSRAWDKEKRESPRRRMMLDDVPSVCPGPKAPELFENASPSFRLNFSLQIKQEKPKGH